jgi:hypothetical protein
MVYTCNDSDTYNTHTHARAAQIEPPLLTQMTQVQLHGIHLY